MYTSRRVLLCLLALVALPSLFVLSSAQKKVSVSEVSFDSAVEDIQWAGKDHKTVLLKTTKGRLYRSQDKGRTWSEITETLRNAGKSEFTDVTVESVMISPADRDVVLVVGSHHSHFVSDDSGRTFRRIRHTAPIHSWQFHPSLPRYALLSAWSDACNKASNGGEPCNHMLYVTRDLGQSFQMVASYVVQFSWGDAKHNQDKRIYFTHHRSKAGEQTRYGGWTKNVDFAYTDDFGSSIQTMVYRGNKFLVSNGYLFVAKLADANKQTVALMVSTDGGKNFDQAQLPFELQERSYTILDTSEGEVILHVNHGDDGKSGTGNVYISGPGGRRFSLSLPGNVRSPQGECEFDKVLSLDGVYIANFKDDPDNSVATKSESELMALRESEEDEARNADASQTAVDKKHRVTNKGKSEEVVKTVITFDKGAVWSYLRAPKIDSTGQKIDCPPDRCWLHLHGVTNFHSYAPFYSVDNAVGIIMGTGNVGPSLRYEADDINTYLSRDGGLTWVEAHKGAFIYEFGDHGGLIVMADDLRKTNQVVFSWNEGQSWYDFELGKLPVDVDNIVIQPDSSSVEFLLYGTRGETGVVFHLDFGALGQPPCKGVWSADSVSSDYETWTPTDGRIADSCLLGRQVTYTRRKQTSECFNGQDFNRPVHKKNCACTMEDFECEFGFTRRIGSTECIADDASKISNAQCTSANYFVTDAYRKVPGDSCEGGWVPTKATVACPNNAPMSRGAYSVLFVIALIAVLLGGMAYVSKDNNGKMTDKFNIKAMFQKASNGFDSFNSYVKYEKIGKGSVPDSAVYGHAANNADDFDDEDGLMEDTPSLLSYTASKNKKSGPTSPQPPAAHTAETLEAGLIPLDDEGEGGRVLARRSAAAAASAPVPRLAPPSAGGALINVAGGDLESEFMM